MKTKAILFLLPLLALTSCTISFTNTPAGSHYDGSSSMPSSEINYIQSAQIPTGLSKHTITFNANHVTTQPSFKSENELLDALKIYDTESVINGVGQFKDVAYGPECLVVNELELNIDTNFSYSYVSISATPFFVRSRDHLNNTYVFHIEKGALSLNSDDYIALNEAHDDYVVYETLCNFATNSHTLFIKSLDSQIFINSISFYY